MPNILDNWANMSRTIDLCLSILLNCISRYYTLLVQTPIDKYTVYITQSRDLPTIVAREPGGMKAKIKKKEEENLHYIRKGNEGIQERKCGYHIATGQYITPFRTKQKRRQKFELQHSLCDEMVSN